MTRYVSTYQGIKIYRNDDGYYGSNGPDQFGYHDKLEDIEAEIDDYWNETQHGELNGFFN